MKKAVAILSFEYFVTEPKMLRYDMARVKMGLYHT